MTSIEELVGREYGNHNSSFSVDDDDNEGNEKKRKNLTNKKTRPKQRVNILPTSISIMEKVHSTKL
jgi:hypothetical protein